MEDHEPTPSAATLDSQSVETATVVSIQVGYDGGKQVKGRNMRHLLVDILRLVVMVVLTAGNVNERDGARRLFEKLYQIHQRFPALVRIWVDGGYHTEKFMRPCDGYLSLDYRSPVASPDRPRLSGVA